MSVDARNRFSDDVIVVPIFSRGRLGPTRVAVPRGVGGLPNDSLLFCDEVTTVILNDLTSGPLGPPVPDDVLRRAVAGILNAVAP